MLELARLKMRTALFLPLIVSGTALANPRPPPEIKSYLDSEKLLVTISPTDATVVATFTFRSDEDISNVSSTRSEDVTVSLTIWLPEDGVGVLLPRRFAPYNDNRVPLVLENGVYREPINTGIRMNVLAESPERMPLSKDYYEYSEEHRKGGAESSGAKSFLEPNFYKLVLRFFIPRSVVENRHPLTFSYKSPLVHRQNGGGLFYYVPYFDNLPSGISTSDTNRYAITLQATTDCSLEVTTCGKTVSVAGGKSTTVAPKANEPIRTISTSLPLNRFVNALANSRESKPVTRQAEICSMLVQSQIYTVEERRNNPLRLVFYATQFPYGTLDVVQNCEVRENGRGSEYLKHPKRGAGRGISTAAVQELPRLTDGMTDRLNEPALKNLVIVSYRRGESWRTSTYDISHAPDQLKQVFDACHCHLGLATNLEERIRQ
jgi:hypothetical protein